VACLELTLLKRGLTPFSWMLAYGGVRRGAMRGRASTPVASRSPVGQLTLALVGLPEH
jgi:hypothetical protein